MTRFSRARFGVWEGFCHTLLLVFRMGAKIGIVTLKHMGAKIGISQRMIHTQPCTFHHAHSSFTVKPSPPKIASSFSRGEVKAWIFANSPLQRTKSRFQGKWRSLNSDLKIKIFIPLQRIPRKNICLTWGIKQLYSWKHKARLQVFPRPK